MSDNVFVAVDDGFAYTDICWKSGQKGSCDALPTHISPGEAEIMDISGTAHMTAYKTEDSVFTVNAPFAYKDTRFDDYQFSKESRVMVWHAMQKSGVPEGKVTLGLTLPFETYFRQPETREKKARNVVVPVESYPSGKAFKYEFKTVHVLPEGVMGAIDFLYDDNFNLMHDAQRIGVIDIGGRTTDIALSFIDLVSERNSLMVDMSHSGTENIGVLNIAHGVVDKVKQEYKVSVLPQIVLSKIHDYVNGNRAEIGIFGDKVDITPIIKSVSDQFVDDVWSMTQKKIGDVSDNVDAIVLIGGGSQIVKRIVEEKYPHLHIPDKPHLSNARGMLKYMQMI